ncbi:MAG TPA: acyl-CoA dehydrogenase family protein [Steroidobacteraceae bacterium]|nr:acyl-CoA dehydrogenase family protein [Steroidobacteraceae bacterium]HQW08139.1 acyl-CoA dehydrogenase family protein [Steroidobacteraceae bacterium]HQX46376.1 acyl-CoA dehydrogenase family protein [Steroidobacteraceae bacterium]HQX79414.1 acyl-CoA dehydrogenase family protein [Steroidobacteraceae bacterium]HQZ79254.1 acyl-CoA dehydrogenase family protein [Steroidobacteraceae bacterium]
MEWGFAPEEAAFRTEVREFVRSKLPLELRHKVVAGEALGKADYLAWHRILHERGWIAPNWPRAFGGCEWSAVRQHIFEEECALAGAPGILPFGIRMVGPVIMKFGSAAQQQRFLPRILSGEDWWCQGYSEPGAGSDLASLRTRAERRGEHYLVNGQKTWTTLAQHADWIFCLVRTATEGRPQEGISFLLIDMQAKGVSVRPIIMLDGEHEINEVWFEDVEVPIANRVGEENKGWTYAKYLLGHERTGNAGVGYCRRWLAELKALARRQPGNEGRPLAADTRFRDRIARLEIDLMALEVMNLRVLALEEQRHAPGPEASMLKIMGSELQQALTEATMHALGHEAAPYPQAATGRYLNFRKASIYAGSNEIQRNIITRHLLGF